MSAERPLRVISQEELEKHADTKDCWIAVHGLVLNITPFLNEHPGGGEVIVAVSGRCCTRDFEDVGHTDSARRLADKYIVGVMEGFEESRKIPTNKEVCDKKRAESKMQSSGLLLGITAAGFVGLAAVYFALHRLG